MICEAYNSFYQSIYGSDYAFVAPAGLIQWINEIPITSWPQLEYLFVLYNAGLCRNPFQDAVPVAKARREHTERKVQGAQRGYAAAAGNPRGRL